MHGSYAKPGVAPRHDGGRGSVTEKGADQAQKRTRLSHRPGCGSFATQGFKGVRPYSWLPGAHGFNLPRVEDSGQHGSVSAMASTDDEARACRGCRGPQLGGKAQVVGSLGVGARVLGFGVEG